VGGRESHPPLTRIDRRMSESQAAYLSDISPELLKAIRDVLAAGYGEVIIKIADHKICIIEKKESMKVGK
jgi:hypothetical protein